MRLKYGWEIGMIRILIRDFGIKFTRETCVFIDGISGFSNKKIIGIAMNDHTFMIFGRFCT